jgi:hypothetical protein
VLEALRAAKGEEEFRERISGVLLAEIPPPPTLWRE